MSFDLIFFFCKIRHGDEATGSNYTIYLEHLGGFLPILKVGMSWQQITDFRKSAE